MTGQDLPVPECVESGFEIGGENRSFQGHLRRNWVGGFAWNRVARVMRVKAKDAFALSFWIARLHFADGNVSVADRVRQGAPLKRRPHALKFARRDSTVEHQGLGAATERAESRADLHLVARGGFELMITNLCFAGFEIPEGFGVHRLCTA
ncbi:MAG: hypothetical protein AAFY60_16630 [Myxococcota bacterium]